MDDLENTVAEASDETPDKNHDTPVAEARPVNEDALREEGRQEGKTAERERVKAILAAPEAEGRADLARSLALETDLDAEAAIRVLSSAPEQAKGGAALSAAMANVRNPVVGADDPETQEDADIKAMTARALSSLGHNIKKGV